MYDFRRQIVDPWPDYRLRLPSDEPRRRRIHPGQRPGSPLDLGCFRPGGRARSATSHGR